MSANRVLHRTLGSQHRFFLLLFVSYKEIIANTIQHMRTYHLRNIDSREHFHLRWCVSLVCTLDSFRSCIADSSQNLSDTKPVANDVRANIPDSLDAVLSSFSVRSCKWCCNSHTNTTYTIRPTDERCATIQAKVNRDLLQTEIQLSVGNGVLWPVPRVANNAAPLHLFPFAISWWGLLWRDTRLNWADAANTDDLPVPIDLNIFPLKFEVFRRCINSKVVYGMCIRWRRGKWSAEKRKYWISWKWRWKWKWNTDNVGMRLSKITVEHCAHHVASRNQHRPMRFHLSVVQFECDVTECASIDAFLQILFDKLKRNDCWTMSMVLRAFTHRCIVANIFILICRWLYGCGYRFTQIWYLQEVGGLLDLLYDRKTKTGKQTRN